MSSTHTQNLALIRLQHSATDAELVQDVISLVIVENDIQLAHLHLTRDEYTDIAIILIQDFHKVLNEFQSHKLVFVLVDRDDEI